MNERNPEALATAYRRAVGKSLKIKELGITKDFTAEEIDCMIELLAKKKAELTGKKWETHVAGQRWYVEDLVKFSGMDANTRLEYEYAQAFPDTASEDELLNSLEALIA